MAKGTYSIRVIFNNFLGFNMYLFLKKRFDNNSPDTFFASSLIFEIEFVNPQLPAISGFLSFNPK